MVHTYEKSASLHYASFLTLTEVKCCRCPASCSEMLFAESKNVFAASKPFFFLAFFPSSPQFLRLSQPSPPPPRSPFSVYPSFLIHFLCITPLLSTPIYSALPPPIFHKHTLYFPLLPSVTLPPSLPRSPPVRYNTFLYVSPSPPFYYLFVFSPVTSSHANLTRFFPPLIFTSHLVCHSVYIPAACLRWCHPSFLIDYSKHVMYFGT